MEETIVFTTSSLLSYSIRGLLGGVVTALFLALGILLWQAAHVPRAGSFTATVQVGPFSLIDFGRQVTTQATTAQFGTGDGWVAYLASCATAGSALGAVVCQCRRHRHTHPAPGDV